MQHRIIQAPSPPPKAPTNQHTQLTTDDSAGPGKTTSTVFKRKREMPEPPRGGSMDIPDVSPPRPSHGEQYSDPEHEQIPDVDGDALDDDDPSDSLKDQLSHDPLDRDHDHDHDELDSLPHPSENQDDDDDDDVKVSLHIEVRLRSNSTILYDTVRQTIGRYITDNFTTLETHSFVPGWQAIKFLENEVYSVYCAESGQATRLASISKVKLNIHVYELPAEGQDKISMLCANPMDPSELGHEAEPEDETGDVAASRIELPANRCEGIWESLIYEEGLKTKLLNYIYSSIVFAEHDVNPNLISWHRLVLLHGPPGTGKTSLCKALAQKVSIRLSGIYQKTELVEINSHSLFSKWFSESGKLVQGLFSKIEQIAENRDVFVLVLIDEVESLAGSRSTGASGGEPSDALRAVNSLLTALDKLRHHKNVLVLTTSNLTDSIDEAFLDRADIKQFIGLPSAEAVYWILGSCLRELISRKIVKGDGGVLLDYKDAVLVRDSSDAVGGGNMSLELLKVAEAAKGLSGRFLRRLPLLGHAQTGSCSVSGGGGVSCWLFFECLLSVVESEQVQ